MNVAYRVAKQWGLRTEDDAQWGELLEQVISKAYDYGLDSQTVLDNITAFISAKQTLTSGISSTRAAELLISHLDIVEVREIPEVLVEFVNDTMRSTYPPEARNKPCRCGSFAWTASWKVRHTNNLSKKWSTNNSSTRSVSACQG